MRHGRRAVRDRGAADALGLVLIAPAVIGLALLVVSLGRSVESRSSTQAVAEAAAQAAALERSPGAARDAAARVVETMLELDVDTCASRQVDVDTSEFRAGGSVAVTVTCSASDRGVEIVQDGPRVYSVRATARIDPFRATEGP